MTRHISTSRPPTQNTHLRLPARFRARLLQRAQRHLPSEAGTARAVLAPRGVTAAHAAVEGRAVRGPSFARSVMPVGVRVRVRLGLGLGLGLGSGLRLGLECAASCRAAQMQHSCARRSRRRRRRWARARARAATQAAPRPSPLRLCHARRVRRPWVWRRRLDAPRAAAHR